MDLSSNDAGWQKIEDREQKCFGVTGNDHDSSLIERDFKIGGCYVIKDFTDKLENLVGGSTLDLGEILWYNPCFTYDTSKELLAYNYEEGTVLDQYPGSSFEVGYYSMNCQFGTALNFLKANASSTRNDEKYDRVLIGAAGQHQQGNIFKITRNKLSKHEPVASGYRKTQQLTKWGLLEYSIPDYDVVTQKDKKGAFQASAEADSRSGQEINVIRLGKTEFIVDTAINDINPNNHKKSGCVRFYARKTGTLTVAEKEIASLKLDGNALTSGDVKVCGVLSHESFGYSTVVADVNGDGLEDLVIGAPRYTHIPPKGSAKQPELDIGRIVILLQTDDNQLDDENQIEIRGVDQFGQFGFKIDASGDINNDGIEDLVVSAPYAGWDRKFPEKETGKVFVTFGSKSGQFCAAIDDKKSTNDGFHCLANSHTNTYIKKAKELGANVKVHNSESHKVLHVAATGSDKVFGVDINEMYRYKLSWGEEVEITKDESGKLQMLKAQLCVEYLSKPAGAEDADIYVELQLDNRLVQRDFEILLKPKFGRRTKTCNFIERKIQVHSPAICNNDPLEMMVSAVRFAKEKGYGLDYGCANQLPKLSVPLPDNLGLATVSINVEKNVDSVVWTPRTKKPVIYDIEVEVVNRNNLRHPYLLVDFDPAEAEVDRSAAAMLDWDVTSCPAENEECGNYNEVSRLCLRKNLGATLNSKIGKLKESFALLLHPTGSQETIDLTVQMFSCSSCQKVSYQCNGKKCDKFVSSIDVTAQDLVDPSDIAVRSQKTRIEYLPVGEKQENDVLNRFIDFEYTVKLTGETPVEEGDLKVKIDFPTTVQKYKASDYFKNPCETNTIKSQIMDIKCVDFNSKNGFSLEASSNTKVTKTARKEMKIEVRLEGVDGDSCPPSDLVLNMTVTTTVDHKFYSEPQKFNSERQQFFLESKCQTVTQ